MDTHDPALRRLVDQVATARDMRAPLDIRGGGTKAFYGGEPCGEPLPMGGLTGISSYEPSELVVTARAGTPLAELQAALAEKGQCLPFDPPHFLAPYSSAPHYSAPPSSAPDSSAPDFAAPGFAAGSTVGGMVAAGLAGPPRAAVGSVRDHVLGVTLLNGRGELLTFGGQVMKNVAGYDVSRLLVGSLGVLGAICEVSIKVLPAPSHRASIDFDVDLAQSLSLLAGWAGRPLPIHAAAWHAGRLRVRLAGARAAVDAAWRTLGGTPVDDTEAEAGWADLRDHRHPFFDVSTGGDVRPLWRLSVPASAAPSELPGTCLVDWAGAQRWWRTDAPADTVRAAAARAGGHATLFRGGKKSVGVFTPLSAPLMRIHRGLKREFDPHGVFNPGRLYADL